MYTVPLKIYICKYVSISMCAYVCICVCIYMYVYIKYMYILFYLFCLLFFHTVTCHVTRSSLFRMALCYDVHVNKTLDFDLR